MHQIDEQLWIGNASDLRKPRGLCDAGIRAVVDVAWDEPIAVLPRDFIYCRFPLVDAGGNEGAILRQAVLTTTQLLNSSIPTIVGCSAGMSRSPTVAAFALAMNRRIAVEGILEEITKVRALEINPEVWKEMSEATKDLRS